MCRGNEQRLYALVGFSEEVDRRPLRFIEPIPPAWVCNLCGVVPRTSGILPCGHCLCKPCYRVCATEDVGLACPLDCEAWPPEDAVSWKDVSFENLSKRQVMCWNEENGCQVVTTVSQISKHYHHVCQHHSACCPRCSAVVLSIDMCAHLRSQCGIHVVSRALKRNTEHSTVQQTVQPQLSNAKPDHEEALRQNSATTAAMKAELEEIHSTLKVIADFIMGFQEEKAGATYCKQMSDGHRDDMKNLLGLQDIQLNEVVHSLFIQKEDILNAFCRMKEELLCVYKKCAKVRKEDEQQMTWLATFVEIMHSKMDNLQAGLEGLSFGINSATDRLNGLLERTDSLTEAVKGQGIQMDQMRAMFQQLFNERNSHNQDLDELCNKNVVCTVLQEVQASMSQVRFALEEFFIEHNLQSGKLGEVIHKMDVLTETLKKEIGGKDNEVKSMLEVLIVQSNSRNEGLRYFSSEINKLSKLLQLGTMPQEELRETVKKGTASLECSIPVSDCGTLGDGEYMPSGGSRVVACSTNAGVITLECKLDGYSSLKEAAVSKGRSGWYSKQQCMGAYQISLGVLLRKNSDSVSLHMCVQLHGGSMDMFLEWPASIEMAIAHPKSREKQVLKCQGLGAAGFEPVDRSTKHVFSQHSFILLKDLEDAGYVRNDQLLLRFTLLSPCANKENTRDNRKPRKK